MSVTNLTLYRVLVKLGATDTEAEQAAQLDSSTLATKADLAELKAELIKWNVGTLIAMTVLYGSWMTLLKVFG